VDEFHGDWQPALFTKTPALFQSEQLFDGAAGGGNRILFKFTLTVPELVLKRDFLQFALIILHRPRVLRDPGPGIVRIGDAKISSSCAELRRRKSAPLESP
jgi:hypothetical protein